MNLAAGLALRHKSQNYQTNLGNSFELGWLRFGEEGREEGLRGPILPSESVLAGAICLPSSADAAKSGRKPCSRSVENLVSPWNGYSGARNVGLGQDTGPALLIKGEATVNE